MSTVDGPPRRKRLSSAERREMIEHSSTELFAERGYDGTSMNEIARRAGVSAPVVYDHFPSKLALYRHLLEQDFSELASIWTSELTGAGSAEERFRGAIDAWLTRMQQRSFTPRLLFRVTSADEEVRAAQHEINARTRQLLLPLVARNLLGIRHAASPSQSDEIALVFEIFSAAMQALVLWWFEHPATPRQFIVDTAFDTLWPGLATNGR